MKNAFAIARKDLASYLNSWTGVWVVTSFLCLSGIFFTYLVLSYAKISAEAARTALKGVEGLGLTRFVYGSYFLNLAILLVFLVPLLSMRTIAEERRHETLELLFTYPLSDFEIVWGKFLALVWFFEGLFLVTLLYIPLLHALGGRLDGAPILSGYLGFWLLGNAYLALGLFISAISESQIVSAAVTFGALVVFWILDWAATVADGPLALFFAALSPLGHYRDFALGILDLSHIVYFVFFNLYFLFLALRAVESRNWKG